MGKCLSKDKDGGARAPAPAKSNGTYAHITVRELREEHFPSGKTGRKLEASTLLRPVHEKQFKDQDVKEQLNVSPNLPGKSLGAEDGKVLCTSGAAQEGGAQGFRESSFAEATLTPSVGLESKDAVPDFAKDVNGLGLDARLAPALDCDSGVAGLREEQVVLSPVQTSRSQSPTAGAWRGEPRSHSRWPSMSSTEFAGHFSDFDHASPTRVEAKVAAKSPSETLKSPSSSPVKSVKESVSVKASAVVKSTPTKSEVKPTKSGRYALKDISLNAPLKREQAHKRQLSKSPVLQGLDVTQEEIAAHQQAPVSLPTDLKQSRSAKRSKDWSPVPDDFSGITSVENPEKEALLAPAAQQTNISITLNVDIDSGSNGHSTISLRHEETLPAEGNTSVTTTVSTSPKMAAAGTEISSCPILPSPTRASCDEGWLISSLILDQDKDTELQSKNLGSLEFPSLDSLPHALPQTEVVDCTAMSGLALGTDGEKPSHFHDEEQSCGNLQNMTGSVDPATNLFDEGLAGQSEAVRTSDMNSITDTAEPLVSIDGDELSKMLQTDTSELPSQVAGDSGEAVVAMPSTDDGSLELNSADSDADKCRSLDKEQEVVPNNLIEGAGSDVSVLLKQDEHVSGDEGACQEQTSLLQPEPVCEKKLSGETLDEEACQGGVPALKNVTVEAIDSENLEAGSAVESVVDSPETLVVRCLHDDDMGPVSPFQLGATDMVANCTPKADAAFPVVIVVASPGPEVTDSHSLEASETFDATKMVDVEVSGDGSSQIGSTGQIEGFELAIEVVNDSDELAVTVHESSNLEAVEKPEAQNNGNITFEGLSVEEGNQMNKDSKNDDPALVCSSSTASASGDFSSSSVSSMAFGSPFQEYQVNEYIDADPPLPYPYSTGLACDASSTSGICSGAFGSPFKEYMSTSLENEQTQTGHLSTSEQQNNIHFQELQQASGCARDSLEFEAEVPVEVATSVLVNQTEESSAVESTAPAVSAPTAEHNAPIIMPSPNKIRLQPSSDSFLVKLPPASKRTSSLPFIPRPPRPEKKVTESQVADILSSFSDRPQRLSTSAPSSPQGPIFDLSQYSLPSTPGDSCPRRSSVDSRGSEGGLIFDLSQFSLPSTPLSMSARSSPMSHSSTPKKLGHANAIALTPEEIAEIWGAFEQGSHASSPAAV